MIWYIAGVILRVTGDVSCEQSTNNVGMRTTKTLLHQSVLILRWLPRRFWQPLLDPCTRGTLTKTYTVSEHMTLYLGHMGELTMIWHRQGGIFFHKFGRNWKSDFDSLSLDEGYCNTFLTGTGDGCTYFWDEEDANSAKSRMECKSEPLLFMLYMLTVKKQPLVSIILNLLAQ